MERTVIVADCCCYSQAVVPWVHGRHTGVRLHTAFTGSDVIRFSICWGCFRLYNTSMES